MAYQLVKAGSLPQDSEALQEVKTPTICAGGFLIKNNKFLFGKRSKKKDWAPGLWDIVSGHALKHEHPLLTLRREIWEETDVQVLNAQLLTTAAVINVADSQHLFTYLYIW